MKIGIRKETQYPSEKRAVIAPKHIQEIINNSIEVYVEPADQRVFSSEEYLNKGAKISEDLSMCDLILGVKEVPIPDLIPNKPYCFFSHTIKGQNYNMPMLQAILEKNITLFDYELVKNEKGVRIVFFGKFAGYAGIINSLWLLGRRFKSEGIENPFSKIKQAMEYDSLASAKDVIKQVGEDIAKNGLPDEITPVITGFSGYGNVSKGAQSLYDYLPHKVIHPAELEDFIKKGEFSNKIVYKVEFREVDMYEHPTINEFDFNHFVKFPNEYKSIFSKYLENLTMLVNGIYWEEKFPKHVTKDFMKKLYETGSKQKLKVIGDITCDIEGSVELTVKSTKSSNPTFVYEPLTKEVIDGVEGNGPVILAVDKLPAELPREASRAFGDTLLPFLKDLVSADYSKNYDELEIPVEFKKAIIAHKGVLTPDFKYLSKYLKLKPICNNG